MTKAKTQPCAACTFNSASVPCSKGHSPRWYKDKGLRRVCDDFSLRQPEPVKGGKRFAFVEAIMRLFGYAR